MMWECSECGQHFEKRAHQEQRDHAIDKHGGVDGVRFAAVADYQLGIGLVLDADRRGDR